MLQVGLWARTDGSSAGTFEGKAGHTLLPFIRVMSRVGPVSERSHGVLSLRLEQRVMGTV